MGEHGKTKECESPNIHLQKVFYSWTLVEWLKYFSEAFYSLN